MLPHRSQHGTSRGFTLIEVMMALVILLLGSIAAAELTTVLSTGTKKTSITTDAVALANQLAAEINDARFTKGSVDPGLATFGPVHAHVASSNIWTVGDFPSVNPTLTASYEVRQCLACNDPFTSGQSGLDGIDVVITIDNYSGNLDRMHGLQKPIYMFLRREYVPSSAAVARGW